MKYIPMVSFEFSMTLVKPGRYENGKGMMSAYKGGL
jgi:hypothetical protein